jgi:hypothetical protein
LNSVYDGVEESFEYKGKIIYAFPCCKKSFFRKSRDYDDEGKPSKTSFLKHLLNLVE